MFPRTLVMASMMFFTIFVAETTAQEGYPLTVTSPDGSEQVLHLDDLDALGQVEFSTTTIWTDGTATFSGVPLLGLLRELGVDGMTLRLTALNDYSVEMPVSELGENAPIIAARIDGQTMSVREKGPYWVIYPFDSDPNYQTEVIYSRSVWQLNSITLSN